MPNFYSQNARRNRRPNKNRSSLQIAYKHQDEIIFVLVVLLIVLYYVYKRIVDAVEEFSNEGVTIELFWKLYRFAESHWKIVSFFSVCTFYHKRVIKLLSQILHILSKIDTVISKINRVMRRLKTSFSLRA